MSKFMLLPVTVLLTLLVPFSANSESTPSAATWFLPQKISDHNTQISFVLDSTWHTVHGSAKKVTGELTLQDSSDPTSLSVKAELPVVEFDTDNSMRDRELRSVMAAESYPTVIFEGQGLKKKCTPAIVQRDGNCSDIISGLLTIRAVTKHVELPILISKEGPSFIVSGDLPIVWGEYGVEDPSMWIARVDPVVIVKLRVVLSDLSKEDR